MQQVIDNYSKALQAHLEAQRVEGIAKDKLRKTRHALLVAKEELRAIEAEILEEQVRDIGN
jgi:hypothetical protein